jgi:hypothetical protein
MPRIGWTACRAAQSLSRLKLLRRYERPAKLAEVAERSKSIEDFGRTLRDWLHGLRHVSSRPEAAARIADPPCILRNRFSGGATADAWLGAYAEYLAGRADIVPPKWAFGRLRVSPEPWFADDSGSLALRLIALRQSPLPFKRRNLYILSVELPLRLRAGRPAKSPEHSLISLSSSAQRRSHR